MRTTFIMTGVISLSNLMQWEAHIEKLNRQFPNCWGLIAAADDRGRGEFMNKTLARLRMEIDLGGQPPPGWFLERAALPPRSHLDSQGKPWKTPHTNGGGSQHLTTWWTSCTTRRTRGPVKLGRQPEEEGEQSEKRSEEEKDEGRQRRVGCLEKQQETKRKGWRWKRLQRKGWQSRGGVLRLEQREWLVRRIATRRKLQRKSSPTTSLHHMQIPWPSVERVPTKTEQDLNIFELIFYLGRGHGGERQKTEKEKGDKEKEAPDRSGVKKNLDDRRGTKRKLHAGEDPPDDEDPKPGKIHYVGNFVTFEEFLEERTFLFIHHFSGRVDNLSKAVKEESEKLGLTVHTKSVDIELGDDLTASEPYLNHLDYARQGRVDGFHAGFPCNTFSKLRWRPAVNMPGPLRSKSHPFGFDDLTPAKKQECDIGTLLMARSANMVRAITEADEEVKVPSFATLENPPPSRHAEHVSAWHMPEMVQLLEDIEVWQSAFFHTCGYEENLELGSRHFKPQLIGGTLQGLQTLRRSCQCGDRPHEPIFGKEKSKKSAEYPKSFCQEYGRLAAKHFMRIARSEFWEARTKTASTNYRTRGGGWKKRLKLLRKGQGPYKRPKSTRKGPRDPVPRVPRVWCGKKGLGGSG